MERSKELDSIQGLVTLCPRSNPPDQTKIDQRLPFECEKELKNKLSRKILRNCNKINDKPETVRKNENNLTNDSSLNGVNVDLISNRNIVDNRVRLKDVDSDLSSPVKTMKDDPSERNDLCINSVTQILVAIPDPVTNEIKNILLPIETRDASRLNVIKSVLVPIRDSNGVISYDIKKVMVPIRSELNLSQPSKVENKMVLVDSTNKPVKNEEKEDERISNENETRINEEITLDVKNNVQHSSSEEATKNLTKDKEEEDRESQIVSIQECQKEETDQILETLKNVCPVCQKVFKSENMMQRHVRKFHEKTYPCDKCRKCYPSKLSLEEHKKSHEDDSYLQCSMCHLKYKRKIGLKYHQIRVHSNMDPKFMCDYCGKRFKLKLDLSVHIEKIHMGIAHICKICGKVVKNITHHEWQHDRAAKKVVYKYSCDLCPKKFTTRNNLDNHLLMHKDGFKCTLCDEVFSSPFALGSHKSTKHRPGAICPICEKVFNSTSNFYQHVLTHAGIRPYKCDICGEDFTQRSSVLRHRKTHPGPLPPLTDPTPIADTARKILEQLSSA